MENNNRRTDYDWDDMEASDVRWLNGEGVRNVDDLETIEQALEKWEPTGGEEESDPDRIKSDLENKFKESKYSVSQPEESKEKPLTKDSPDQEIKQENTIIIDDTVTRGKTHSELVDRYTKRSEKLKSRQIPLNDIVFDNRLGEIVQEIAKDSPADPVNLYMTSLVYIGNRIGKKPHVSLSQIPHPFRFYVGIIGLSGYKGRKGTGFHTIENLVRHSEGGDVYLLDHLIEGLKTGEGLVHNLRYDVDDHGQMIMNPNRIDNKMFLATEGGTILTQMKQETSILSHVLRDMMDKGRVSTDTKGQPEKCTGHLSGIFHCTPDEFNSQVKQVHMRDGTFNRFLWHYVSASKYMPTGLDGSAEIDFERLAKKLNPLVENFNNVGEIKMTSPEAIDENAWYLDGLLDDDDDDNDDGQQNRFDTHLMKLNGIHAGIDGRGNTVGILPKDVSTSSAILKHSEKSIQKIFKKWLGNPIADKIHDYIMKNPLKQRSGTDINKGLFQGNKETKDLKEAINYLMKNNGLKKRQEDTNGRARNIYYYEF